jgi:hypothetical protein
MQDATITTIDGMPVELVDCVNAAVAQFREDNGRFPTEAERSAIVEEQEEGLGLTEVEYRAV